MTDGSQAGAGHNEAVGDQTEQDGQDGLPDQHKVDIPGGVPVLPPLCGLAETQQVCLLLEADGRDGAALDIEHLA